MEFQGGGDSAVSASGGVVRGFFLRNVRTTPATMTITPAAITAQSHQPKPKKPLLQRLVSASAMLKVVPTAEPLDSNSTPVA